MRIEQAIVLLLVAVSLLALYGIVYIRNLISNDNRITKLEEFKVYSSLSNETLLLSALDNMITTLFERYILLNVETNTSFKINSETEMNMTKDVSEIVMQNISPILLSNLSLIYNKDKIAQVISDRVYMQVFAFLLARKNKG